MTRGLWRRSFDTSAAGTTRPPACRSPGAGRPACPHRVPQDSAPTNPVTPPPPPRTPRMRSPTENCSFPGRFGAGLLPGTGLLVPGPPQNGATSRAWPGRSAPATCHRHWGEAKTARRMPNYVVYRSSSVWQGGIAMTQTRNQFSLARAASSASGCAKKQIHLSLTPRSTQ